MTTSLFGVTLPNKLEGSNYSTWKIRMKEIFILKKLWGIIFGQEIQPTGLTLIDLRQQEEYDGRNQDALTMIRMLVTDDVLSHVKDA